MITPGESEVSRALLERLSLAGIARLDENYFLHSEHGQAAAAALLGAVELARRLARMRIPKRLDLQSQERVAHYLSLRYQCDQEVFGALFLDTRQRLIMERELYRGTLDRASVEPRGVLKAGILCEARSFIAFHTHPSGDPSPSIDDLDYTRRLADAGDIVGVKLDDHLIIGRGNKWVSLKSRGDM